MKAATSKTNALPGMQSVIALAIAAAENSLMRLIEQRAADEHWDDADVDVDLSVELALAHVARMKQMVFETDLQFEGEWLKAAAAINLASKLFSRGDCSYLRMLKGASEMFVPLAGLVEFSKGA